MGDDILVKILGMVDLSAAIIIALMTVPIIGILKWILVGILTIKAIPSLLA
jgi:hypothetical protein